MATLHATADSRSYDVLCSPDELRALFHQFGFKHFRGRPGSIYTDRWEHGEGLTKTVLIFFEDSKHLSLLGPAIKAVEELAVAE